MNTSCSGRRAQRGVTLVEALVALVVMSVGLMGFAGLHSRLRLNNDVARQRAEAVRLAQEDIENFRAYSTLAQYDALAQGTAEKGLSSALASGNTTSLNTTYTIDRRVTVVDSRMKVLRVKYTWADMRGASHSVSLRTVVAEADPKLAARLSLAPNGSPTKDPLGRDAVIPVPSKNLGDGTSVYKPTQSGTVAFVFDNDSGEIKRKCTGIAATTTTAGITSTLLADGASACTNVTGYLLAGYVRFFTDNGQINADEPNNPPLGAVTMSVALDGPVTDTTKVPLGKLNRLNTSYWTSGTPSSSGYPAAADCGAEDSRTYLYTRSGLSITQTNNGVTTTTTTARLSISVPAATPVTAAGLAPYVGVLSSFITDVVDTGERYVAYTCVVYPRDLNGVMAWTGRSTLAVAGQTIASTGASNIKVCRYSSDYDGDGSIFTPSSVSVTPALTPDEKLVSIDNAEHPNAYIRVTGGLTNQNFLVIYANRDCPSDTGVEVDGDGSENYTDATTVTHQP